MTVAQSRTFAPVSPIPAARRPAGRPARRSAWALQPAEARPVAAVRVSDPLLFDFGDALREAGLAVLDIRSQQVGPAPVVIVLEVPDDADAARRLTAAGAAGPGRVLLAPAGWSRTDVAVRGGVDEVVPLPCHPLQVAAAALRVGGAPEWQVAQWSERAFADVLPG